MSERNSKILPQTVHLLLAAIGGFKMLRLPQKVQQVIAVKSFAGRGFIVDLSCSLHVQGLLHSQRCRR
jgi:hypothetical protein